MRRNINEYTWTSPDGKNPQPDRSHADKTGDGIRI